MNRSQNAEPGLLPIDSALQHERVREHAPRPLPLFLVLVRQVSRNDPELARQALVGLRAYADAAREDSPAPRPEVARVRGATLRDFGGSGPPVVLVPSLINPPGIVDLDADVSLTRAIAGMNRHVLLLDWGDAGERSDLNISDHVAQLLLPLLQALGKPAALVGYCLGGTMALAAANLIACERLVTLAAPWHFAAYPDDSRASLAKIWRNARGAAQTLGALPMEVLQSAFWSLDPERTVRKFAEFSKLEPSDPKARRFIALEDWANQGEPLPYPAAVELLESMFAHDVPGRGEWRIGDRIMAETPALPTTHLLAARDIIAPPATAPAGEARLIPAGHVGMVVGSVRAQLHSELARALDPGCR